jgi:hypothetical protein
MLPAAASLALLLAASETIQWTSGVEIQARGRNEPTDDRRAGLADLDLRGYLGLSGQGAEGAAALTYRPSLLLRQVVFGMPVTTGNATRHGGNLELQTRLAPVTRLTSRTSVEWGLTDFSPLAGQAARVVVGPLPPQHFVRTLSVETMLELTHAYSRRLQLSLAAGFQRSGGIGHDAIQVLPFQAGPQATASLAWVADRANSITLLAFASESRFSIARTSVLSNLEADWTHRASAHTLLDAGAGLAFVHSSGLDSSSIGAYGLGTVGVAWDLPLERQRALRASLRLRLLPGVDRLTALAIQTVRAEGGAELTEGRLRLGLSVLEARAISGVFAGTDDLRFEARAGWTVTRGVSLEGGLAAARTNQPPFTGWQFQAFVGLRWADRGSF